jgi:hypothetical protein
MISGNHYTFQYDSAADSATGAYILMNPSTAALQLVATGTASGAATVDIAIPTGYRDVEIHYYDIVPVTDAQTMYLRISTDSGSNYISTASYYTALDGRDSPGTAFGIYSTAATAISLSSLMSNNGLVSNQTTIRIPNPAGSSFRKPIGIVSDHFASTSAYYRLSGMGVYNAGNVDITNVRVFMNSGNVSLGYRVYGWR